MSNASDVAGAIDCLGFTLRLRDTAAKGCRTVLVEHQDAGPVALVTIRYEITGAPMLFDATWSAVAPHNLRDFIDMDVACELSLFGLRQLLRGVPAPTPTPSA